MQYRANNLDQKSGTTIYPYSSIAKIVAASTLVCLLLSFSGVARGFTFEGKQVSELDIRALPPVCKLILFKKKGAHHGAGSGPLDSDAHLFSRPGYEMGAQNPHLHHYCWSILHKFDYFRARTQVDRDRRYKEVISDIDYVIENTTRGWPYFHVMFVEQATMMLLHRDYRKSLLKIELALQHKPDYDRAFAVMSDVYAATGDKKAAIKAAQEGLAKNPNSVLLRKRLQLLGVSVPSLPEPKANEPLDSNTAAHSVKPSEHASESDR